MTANQMHQIITPTTNVLFPCRTCSSATNLYIPACTRSTVNSICMSMLLDLRSERVASASLPRPQQVSCKSVRPCTFVSRAVHTENAAQSYNRIEHCTKVLQATEPYDATSSPERDMSDKRTCPVHGQNTPLISRVRAEMPATRPRRDANEKRSEHRQQDDLG